MRNRKLIYSSPFLLLIVLLLNLTASAQAPTEPKRPKVGLVLSGGGAKGFAHIGVIKVLEEEGIPIDIIVGTSIGSLIGGIYSLGYSSDELEKIVQAQNWEQVLSDDVSRLYLSPRDQALKQRYLFSLPFNNQRKLSLPQGVIRGQNVMNVFCGLAGNVPGDADFTKFPIAFACLATNLENGNEEILDHGFLPTAMYASMAIPGVFLPGEHDGKLLVDGGVVNNFPVDVAKNMGADIIIGVDIRDDYYDRTQIKSLGEIFLNLINFYSKSKDEENQSFCNLIIRPNVSGFTGASFSRAASDTLVKRGAEATLNLREQIRELKKQYQLEPRSVSRELVEQQKWFVSDIKLQSDKEMNRSFLEEIMNLPVDQRYDYADIKGAIDRLYGTGGFDHVYFELDDNENGKTLVLHLTPREARSQNIGFRVNTTEAAALLLNATWKDYSRTFSFLSVSTELSANPSLELVAETNWHGFPDLGFAVNAKYQNYNIYNDGKKAFDADVFYTSGKIYIEQRSNTFRTGFAFQEEFFDGDVFARDASDILSDQTSFLLSGASFYLSFDNQDQFYFPRKGTRLYCEFNFNTDLKKDGESSPFLLLKMENIFPVSSKTAFLVNLYGRGILNEYFPSIKSTLIGGEAYSRYFNYHFPFTGMPPVVIGERYSAIGLLGVRFRLSSSQYLSFVFNSLQQGREYNEILPELAVYGGGVKYSLKTIVGPLDVGVGYSDYHSKPTFSANLGYWF
ncbi:patatin-like phospholipase family protein [Mangrovibacterium sp.]|uniref:patatin-like phospholipase family protein n=1 Tax=Mangrovibacterium sp. TaxID=1961364 RepID=UPI0035667E07